MARGKALLSEGETEPSEQLLAAEYVRMSTEHQQYSTQNQAQTIREYTERRGIRIVKTYSDDAKSGLIIGGRMALQQMIADVESGVAEFSMILVYDVTRSVCRSPPRPDGRNAGSPTSCADPCSGRPTAWPPRHP